MEKSLKEIEEEEFDKLNQFLFIVWQPNPQRDIVRITLDDGSIRMTMKRQKFFDIIGKILDDTLLFEAQKVKFRIKESLNTYGGNFFLDRYNLEFRELSEIAKDLKISPHELRTRSNNSEQLLLDKLYEQTKKDWNNVVSNAGTVKKMPASNSRFFSY